MLIFQVKTTLGEVDNRITNDVLYQLSYCGAADGSVSQPMRGPFTEAAPWVQGA